MDFFKKLSIFLYKIMIDLLYPHNCVMCGKQANEEYLCTNCENILEQEALYKIENYKNKYFEKHIYIFKYEKIIRKLIIDYKFNDKSYFYESFIKFLLKNKKICRFFETYDIITPVPIHKKRKALRGYNQSELIARKIARNYKNLKYENLLEKKINTTPQSLLTKLERIENAKNVYYAKNIEKIKGENIILIDDIYTTGSTVNECSKILKKSGAKKVIVITIAKD